MLGRSRDRNRSRGADGTAYGDLARLIALSPSLLIWPAEGAGWQGTSGSTLAASGQPLGLGADLASLQGKTLSEWLATAPELVTNGSFASSITGWTQAFGQIEWDGVGALSCRGDLSASSTALQAITTVVGRAYVCTFDVATNSGVVFIGSSSGGTQLYFNGTETVGSKTVVFVATTTTSYLQFRGSASHVRFDNISVRELPGNHLRAGTWASPSNSARGTFQNNAINFDGVDDFYSLLNAISVTSSMTIIRAFKRATAGLISQGLGSISINNPADGIWFSDNNTYPALGASQGAGLGVSTSTGSFVQSTIRNATTETVRRNGASIGSRAAAAASGSLSALGNQPGGSNAGEISFLAVFPSELTGANLTLVEQIAASTNGATLA